MTGRTNTERILDAFLAPEADRLADRVIEAALADIARTSQRRSWWPAWRSNRMNTYAKLIAAAAAMLVVAVVGYQLLLRGDDTVGPPTAQPSPTATSSPTATTSPAATSTTRIIVDGPLDAGTWQLRPFASGTMTIDATVPDGGWLGGVPNAISGPRGESNGPNGVVVAFLKAQTIHSDPCQWDHDGTGRAPQEGDIEVGPTVDDLVAALGASTAYESTTPVDATLGGFSGKRLELQLTPGPSGCDSYDGAGNQYWVFGGRDGALYAQGDDNRWQLTIVDVDGTRLIAVLLSYAETSGEDLSAAEDILGSIVITP